MPNPSYLLFKTPEAEAEFALAPERLRSLTFFAADYAVNKLGLTSVTVTRVRDAVDHGTESGVHPAGRAVDLRDEHYDAQGKLQSAFTPDEVLLLLESANVAYPRTDGKLAAIHHSANGDPFHFHLQIPLAWLSSDEVAAMQGVNNV